MSTGRLAIVVLGCLTFVLLIIGGLLSEQRGEREQMKACVAAGKEWVRDFGNYYECVSPR